MMDEKFFVAEFSETVASPFLCEHQTNRVQKIDRASITLRELSRSLL